MTRESEIEARIVAIEKKWHDKPKTPAVLAELTEVCC